MAGLASDNYTHLDSIASDGNGKWVVGAENGDLHYSTDNGVTWTRYANGSGATRFNDAVGDMVFDNGYFVGISEEIGMREIGYASASNLGSWQVNRSTFSGGNSDVWAVAYGGGKWVVLGVDNTYKFTIATSPGN
jgi:hypothetical protein